MENKKPIVRIAPSPTGNLHIGTARTALFNFLFARHTGGSFLLRIEDTDKARSTEAFEKNIIEGLSWLGLTTDGEVVRQSRRGALYKEKLQELIKKGAAYVSKEPAKESPSEMVEVVRLKNPGTKITFTDLIHGDITFDTTELKDFVIARSINDPLYHFAVVVDDGEAGITHVIRGEDHISNTPRQILIQEALGLRRPTYAHLPLILSPDRSKLSKRHGAVSLDAYRTQGFLPEAIVNYLALLGWNPGGEGEVFTLAELIPQFDITRTHSAGAIFDVEKLRWFNRAHLLKHSDAELSHKFLPFVSDDIRKLPQFSEEKFRTLVPLIKERVHTLEDVRILGESGDLSYFFGSPSYSAQALSFKGETSLVDIALHLETAREAILNISDEEFGAETVKAALWGYATEVGRGAVLWPLRYALSGKEKSPDPFTLAQVLGKAETISRIERAEASLREAL
jgi:glutamyl-tRNA synthetase